VCISNISQMNPLKFNSYSTFSLTVFLMEGKHFASSGDRLNHLFISFLFIFNANFFVLNDSLIF